jgi:hypothetical protein
MDGGKGDNQYRAFLLRLWRDDPDGGWRATVENVQDGSKQGFASLQQLVAFLEAETDEGAENRV